MQRFLRHHEVRRAVRFGFVGILNTIIDFALFTILQHFLHWPYLWANVVAFLTASVNSYILNRRWTFRSTATDVHRELLQYLAVVGIGFFINEVTLYIIVSRHAWLPIAAKLVATLFSLTWNFLANRFWTFRSSAKSHLAEQSKML